MANRNIPGSGPIVGAVNDIKSNSNAPTTAFTSLDDTVASLRDAMAKGNVGKTRNFLQDIIHDLPRTARDIARFYRDQDLSARQQIKSNEQLVRLSQTHVGNLKKELSILDSNNSAHKNTINLIKQQIGFETSEQNLIRNKNREIQTGIEKRRASSFEQKRSYDDAINQTRKISREVDKMEQARQESFGAHLFRSRTGFNPLRAAKQYGMEKMQANLPEMLGGEEGASLGGFSGGALAAGGAAVLTALVSKVSEMTMRGLKAAVQTGDVFKGAGGDIPDDTLGGILSRRPNTVFRDTMHQAMRGLGVNLEEQAQLATMMRPVMGNAGNFVEVMRQGTAMDRAFGSETGTGAMFMASMVRRSGTSSSDADLNKLSMSIAEATGRGQLIGLQEEMLRGISQLVELTRSQSVTGPNASMFADMIAGLSQIGDKSMRGNDAANVLANMDVSLRNPKNQFGQLIAAAGIRASVEQLVAEGKVSPDQLGSENLLYLQKQGLAVSVPSLEGGSAKPIQFGDLFAQKTVEQANRIAGKGSPLAAMALSQTLGISPTQAMTLSNNANFLGGAQGNDFRKAFGLENTDGILMNTGSNSFIQALSDEYASHTKGQKGPISDKEAQLFLNNAIDRFERVLPSNKLDEVKDLRRELAGRSVAGQVRQVLEFSKTVTAGSPEDDVRNAVVAIENYVSTLVDNVVPAINAIASRVTGGNDSDYFRSKAEETLGVAKKHEEHEKAVVLANKVRDLMGIKSSAEEDKAAAESRAQQLNEYHTDDRTNNPDVDIAAQAAAHNFTLERATKYEAAIAKTKVRLMAQDMGVDPNFALALASVETGGSFNHHQISKKGAVGLMQLMPKTAAALGVDPYDLNDNIRGGLMYAKDQLDHFHGDPLLAAAAYNAGPGAVDKAHGVPNIKETIEYVRKIKEQMEAAKAAGLPRTESQRAQDSGTNTRVGLDNNVNIVVSNPNGQPISQQSKSFTNEINLNNGKTSTPYKSYTTAGGTN